MKEVFTLVLCNQLTIDGGTGFALNTSNKASISYQVNFDALFNGKQKLYKKCQVRTAIISSFVAATALPNAIGSVSAVGLASGNDLGTNGLFLMNYIPSNANASGSSTGYYFNTNVLTNLNGTQMSQVPRGVQTFSINFTNISGALQATGNVPDYRLNLQFELYDDIEQ